MNQLIAIKIFIKVDANEICKIISIIICSFNRFTKELFKNKFTL